jgi:hypothetical protein
MRLRGNLAAGDIHPIVGDVGRFLLILNAFLGYARSLKYAGN